MALFLIDQAQVNVYSVSIKFGRTIKISSLKNENFTVYTDAATPSQVMAPFAVINTLKDYNQISRILTLYWKVTLDNDQNYFIDVHNLVDSSGYVVQSEKINFTYKTAATPSSQIFQTPELAPILIEDKSIKKDVDISYHILAKNPRFFIESIDPLNGDFYLDNSYGNGRVIITFNERPASNFLSNKYFKAQKKKIQKAPSRWEPVQTEISMHAWKPEVYVDFPSNDATPVYQEDEKIYYETGYKYRIIVSKDIGI